MGLASNVDIATTAAHTAVKMLAVSRALPTGIMSPGDGDKYNECNKRQKSGAVAVQADVAGYADLSL